VSDDGVSTGEGEIPGKVYYEIAHGRRIAYQYLNPGKPPKQRRRARLERTWAKIPHDRGLELAKRIGSPGFAVLLVLEHAVHWNKSNIVKLTNDLLGQFGISRQSKTRGLRQLEEAGVIEVVWRGKASPIVKHLWYNTNGELI
jgi:hypothetical protein